MLEEIKTRAETGIRILNELHVPHTRRGTSLDRSVNRHETLKEL